ncbi:MAG: GNAT family protein [Nitrospiraceae bacterium]|nr:GNAT family protein [Nitrospiraceae bacterium]
MLKIRVEPKEGFVSRWFQVKKHFAVLPARIEGRGIRLRHTWMWDKSCPVRYRIEQEEGGGSAGDQTGGGGFRGRGFRPIGFIGLYNLDFGKSAEIAIEISEGERGKGAGGMSLGLFLDGLGKRSIVEELVARVRPDNAAALRLFKRFDFGLSGAPGPDGRERFRLLLRRRGKQRAENGFSGDSCNRFAAGKINPMPVRCKPHG